MKITETARARKKNPKAFWKQRSRARYNREWSKTRLAMLRAKAEAIIESAQEA